MLGKVFPSPAPLFPPFRWDQPQHPSPLPAIRHYRVWAQRVPLRPPPCPTQGSGPPCPYHVLPAPPALTFLAALANLLFMQQVRGERTACFHPRPLPPHPSSTLPGTAPVCDARGGCTEPRNPGTGVLGGAQHPNTTQTLSAPAGAQGLCCFWGFSPGAGVTVGCAEGPGSGLAGSSG